jgi:hypothetical protein
LVNDLISAAPSCPDCESTMVRRRRRADAAPFWGCLDYPGCRGTRPIEMAAGEVDDPGGSADRQFAGRRYRHKAAVAASRGTILRRGALILAVGLATAVAGPPSWRLFGIGVVIVAAVVTVERLYVLPQHVRSWATGGEGERLTADRLAPLQADGFVILHDRKIPGTVANIDHIVIGPTGVWVVETKNYAGSIQVRNGELNVNGRRRQGVRAEVEREVAVVARFVPSTAVQAIVVVHRAAFPWLGTLRLGEVPVVQPGQVAARIRRGPATLTTEQVSVMVAEIHRALPRA